MHKRIAFLLEKRKLALSLEEETTIIAVRGRQPFAFLLEKRKLALQLEEEANYIAVRGMKQFAFKF